MDVLRQQRRDRRPNVAHDTEIDCRTPTNLPSTQIDLGDVHAERRDAIRHGQVSRAKWLDRAGPAGDPAGIAD